MKKRFCVIIILIFLLLPIQITTATRDPKPELTIRDISGGIGLTMRIKNVGTANATGAGYELTHGGRIFLRTTKLIKPLPDVAVGRPLL